jgi:hypothetical protein
MGYESSIYTASDDYYDNISDDEGEEESLLGDVLITSREKTPEEPGGRCVLFLPYRGDRGW